MKIIIVYESNNGHTEQMANAMAEGAGTVVGADVVVKPAHEVVSDDLSRADGIALGSPTHMGSMGWQMKKLIDEVFSGLWMKDVLVGKAGAVFGTGGSGGTGGAELCMLGMLTNLAENGLVLVTHPKNTEGFKPDGMHWGPTCATGRGDQGPKEAHLNAAKAHGKRLAEVSGLLIKN